MKDLVIADETFIQKISNIPKIKAEIQKHNTVSVNLKFSPQVAFVYMMNLPTVLQQTVRIISM